MTAHQVLERHASKLMELGAEEIGVFGSRALGTANPDSDIDIYVKLSDSKRTFRHFNALYEYLESLFSCPVDLVTDQSLNERKARIILPTVKYASLRS